MGLIVGCGLSAFGNMANAIAANQKPAKPKDLTGIFLAESSATDRAAKRIQNAVAEEGLKTITTKEDTASTQSSNVLVVQGTSNDHLAVDHLEQGPAIMRPVISVESAPGFRVPAAETTPHEKTNSELKPGRNSTEAKTPPPEQAQKWLENGNKRYVSKNVRLDGRGSADRKKLLLGQKPHSIVLSCSDSRVPPETVFDQALGEIFVVRTLGASLDSAVVASIEHAVVNLGSQLIVVMGHTSCSALEKTHSTDKDEATASAQGIARDLAQRSEIIRTRVLNGHLKIRPAMYDIDSGLVKFH